MEVKSAAQAGFWSSDRWLVTVCTQWLEHKESLSNKPEKSQQCGWNKVGFCASLTDACSL